MLLALVIDTPEVSATGLKYAVIAGSVVLLAWWLRGEMTQARFLSIWESDGVLSTRLLAATALLVWGMCMYSSGNMSGADLENVLQWVSVFFAVGSVAKAAGAIKGDTTVNAKKADINTDGGDVNLNTRTPTE